MKRLLFLSLFLFLGNLSFSATLPLKKQILLENIEVEKDSITPKERVDVSKYIMSGAIIAGSVMLTWGLIKNKQGCSNSGGPYNFCLEGLLQDVIAGAFFLLAFLIFLGRITAKGIKEHKQAMKNKTK
jgi:hypothetical protein